METKKIKNVKFYQDFELKKEFSEILGNYDIEINNDKARVIQNTIFGNQQKSRFNKLTKLGRTSKGDFYKLIVNGNKVFFVIDHNIYDK